jgi:hypothetical protein
MRLGPIQILRQATFQQLLKMQRLWDHFSHELAGAERAGNPLAAKVLEHTHGLMHSPLSARFAPTVKPTGRVHPGSRAAAERVIAAYRRTLAESNAPKPTPSMWDALTEDRRAFITALAAGDVPTVQSALEHLFDSPLVHGLGQVHTSHLPLLEEPITHLGFRFTDTVVSMAEAVAAVSVSCMGQDAPGHLRPLHRDLDALYDGITHRLGFDASYEDFAGAFGFRVAGRLVTIDSLTHAYAAHRLAQLGASDRSVVFELGGGYGGLALMAHRAGVGRYAIFDLPWVNALQGYFLILMLPANAVRLFGEASGNVRVEPYWRLDAEPDQACDWLVNSDSLPEMGEATARGYLPTIRRVVRNAFLSINQEAQVHWGDVGPQNCVANLMDDVGGFRRVLRQRHWLRQGYVEEVYEPIRS